MRAADTVDTCQIRLLALRTRIDTNWPTGGLFGHKDDRIRASEAAISDFLVALPTPLPLLPGGEPEAVMRHDDTDLKCVVGRAVDAALALLHDSTLETVYHGQVSMLESHKPGSLRPIVVTDPTVGLLVATIIGTLEAISEKLAEPGPSSRPAKADSPQPDGSTEVPWQQPKRGRVVPRI
jgi:hypothetical protein